MEWGNASVYAMAAVSASFMAFGLYTHDAGWAIVGATIALVTATLTLARYNRDLVTQSTALSVHTRNLASQTAELVTATKGMVDLQAQQEHRHELETALDVCDRVRQLQPKGFIPLLAVGNVPGQMPDGAYTIRHLAAYARLIKDENTVAELRTFVQAIDELEQASFRTEAKKGFELGDLEVWMQKLRILQAHLLVPAMEWRAELGGWGR